MRVAQGGAPARVNPAAAGAHAHATNGQHAPVGGHLPQNMTPQQMAAYRAQQQARAAAVHQQHAAQMAPGAPRAHAAAGHAQPQGHAAGQVQPQPAAPAQTPEANHCHLIARTPVFDAHRVVQMYRLRFSSGNKFVTDRVLPQHVAPIIEDFFLRRSILNFVGSKAKALIMMPVNPALVPLVKKGVASRLVLQIPSYQEPSVQVVDIRL